MVSRHIVRHLVGLHPEVYNVSDARFITCSASSGAVQQDLMEMERIFHFNTRQSMDSSISPSHISARHTHKFPCVHLFHIERKGCNTKVEDRLNLNGKPEARVG